ncbi:MAG: hypothetical protein AB7G47_07880 [Mycolicibacterium sp.]|uniref:hypothetical protein n=1 Tax=Mycolicibacterium sp. TaxID=2320850 RepID=UPI003D0971AA
MNIAVKSAIAGAALLAVAALGVGAPMAHAVVDTSDAAHTSTHSSQSTERQAPKFDPTTTTSRHWGPGQFG